MKAPKYLLSFTIYIALIYVFGSYAACYKEQWQTFFYDWHYISETYCHFDGLARLIGDFLTQFFLSPTWGNIIMALVLTLITFVDAHNIHRITGKTLAMPLALIAPLSLSILVFDNNWNIGGTLAYLLTSLALTMHLSISNNRLRLAWAICGSVLLYMGVGGIALLYPIVILMTEKGKGKEYALFFIPLAASIGVAFIGLLYGQYGEWLRAITPAGYYYPRVETPKTVWAPWCLEAIVFAIAALIGHKAKVNTKQLTKKKEIIYTCSVIGAVVVAGIVAHIKTINNAEQLYKEFSTLARYRNWQGVIDKCGGHPSRNVYIQNIITQAWAESELLGEHLLDNPQSDIKSITADIPTGYIAAQMSDIHYSMGHVSLARLYAFEAIEHTGGMSPRLLQRLADVEIIYGEYEVAKKYLNYLRHTLYYSKWAQKRLDMIANDTLSAELAHKRKCILSNNRLRGSFVIGDDLMDIIRQNPTHRATAQYLVAISIFVGTESDYKPMIHELQDLDALPTPMPTHFRRIYDMIK